MSPPRDLRLINGARAFCVSASSPDWQNAVIGLMIFSVAFGFLATILSICGVCTATLPKKIYYYHSAGEIYLICGKRHNGGIMRRDYINLVTPRDYPYIRDTYGMRGQG